MSENSNRRIKILGAGWLGLGYLSMAFVFITLFPLTQGNVSSETEVSDGYWVFIVMGLVMGTIGLASGLALLRRHREARAILVISSLLLALPSTILVFPLLVVVPSLWLTFSRGGKETLGNFIARENG